MIRQNAPSLKPPSGRQFAIAHGSSEAQITEVGGTLRSYTVDGQHVVDGFGIDERSTDGRGQVLAPGPTD
jgi:aldose 1-epimerase